MVSVRVTVGTLAGLAAIGYGSLYLWTLTDTPPSQASIQAAYAASAAAIAAKQRQFPPTNTAAPPSLVAAAPDTTIAQDYECGSAEASVHPRWSTNSIAFYCREHHDKPEAGAKAAKLPADSLQGCITAWMGMDPGASRDYAKAMCMSARSTP